MRLRLRWIDGAAGWLCRRVPLWMAVLGLLVFVLFTSTVLPREASLSAAYTSAAEAPDTLFWYPADALYRAAEAWGSSGRAAYVRARLSFDVVWPLVYGFFLLAALAWSVARTSGAGGGTRRRLLRRLVLLPVLTVALDYAENLCTAAVTTRHPAPTPVLAEIAGVFTAAKWLVLGSCFVLLVVVLVAALAGAVRTGLRR